MKKLLITLMAIFLTIYLINISSAGDVYTSDQVEAIFTKQCKCEESCVISMDEIYEDYPLARALTKANCMNYEYKSNLFDCDDIAYSVKTLVIEHISEINDSGGAVMFGVAFVENRGEKDTEHIVNIGMYKKNIYIYDWQESEEENIIKVKEYLKTHFIHIIII